jgi:DNA-binding MarR family transcriptional regulator
MGVIGRVMRAFHHINREMAPVYKPLGLDFGLFDVLATLRRSGPLPPRELHDWCMVSSGGMTARLDRLEQLGLVERKRDPDDRRSLLIELSPAGLALIDELIVSHVSREKKLVSPLTAAEQKQLAGLLGRFLITLESEPAGDRAASNGRPAESTTIGRLDAS